jgi:hypothetical protein
MFPCGRRTDARLGHGVVAIHSGLYWINNTLGFIYKINRKPTNHHIFLQYNEIYGKILSIISKEGMNIRKAIAIFLFVSMLLTLVACSPEKQVITFKGVGKNWKSTLQFSPRDSGRGMVKEYTIKYIGSNPDKDKNISYQFMNNDEKSTNGTEVVSGSNETKIQGVCSNCSIESIQNDKWELIIQWENQTEKIKMPIQK